ncbi:MAG: ComEC/Rec2 family competence protein [Clostridia bacterium]|nr:ComEC/Rec2 family competence protein [Clostridia bacterium]
MRRPMFLIGFIYIFALATFQSIPEKSLIPIIIASALICLSLSLFPAVRKHRSIIISAITLTFAAIVSFANFKINIEPVQKYDKREEIISGIVDDLPYEKNGTLHYKIKIDHVNNSAVKPFDVMISSGSPLECDFGDRFYCTAHFYTPKSSYFFDSKQYYHSKGIYISAYVKNSKETYSIKNAEGGLKYQIIKLRAKMLEASKNFLTGEIASIQNGIFLGERTNISNLQRINLFKNGIYHLVCTSGIHISIIMAGFLWIFGKLKLGQKLSHLLAIAPLLIFVSLTGFSSSAVRAGIMCMIYLIEMALSKKSDSLNSLGLSIFLICLVSPGSSLSLGLWLSALSMLGITLFNHKIFLFLTSRLSKKLSDNPITKTLILSISVSISASVFTAPLTIFYSKIFSAMQILTNIIFIPLTTIILISALILSTLWVFGAPNIVIYPFAFISGISVNFFIKLSDLFANIPFCYVSLDYPFLKFWVGIIILTVAVCLILFKPIKALVFSVIISITSLICGIFSYQILESNHAKITLINGNEGTACIVRKNGHTACISCFGEKNYTKNFEDFLECNHINNIDYFAIISSENLPDEFINSTAKNHKINCFILPSDSAKYISADKTNAKPIFFDTELHSSLWGGELTVDSDARGKCTYTKITTDEISILITPSGADASNIPENMKNCDMVLSYGVPKNFSKINCSSTIVYGPQYIVSENIPKFPTNVKIYNLAYYGKLNITKKNNNYKIGV